MKKDPPALLDGLSPNKMHEVALLDALPAGTA